MNQLTVLLNGFILFQHVLLNIIIKSIIFIYYRGCVRCELLKSALFYEQNEIRSSSNKLFKNFISNNDNNHDYLSKFISLLCSLPYGYIDDETVNFILIKYIIYIVDLLILYIMII